LQALKQPLLIEQWGKSFRDINGRQRKVAVYRERGGGGGEYGTGESDANANGVAIDYRQEKNRQKQ
jgi:hypothetical protein